MDKLWEIKGYAVKGSGKPFTMRVRAIDYSAACRKVPMGWSIGSVVLIETEKA